MSRHPARLTAVIFGTRPEAIKLAPVILALRSAGEPHLVVTTGQHADLVRQILKPFDIEPDVDLALMRAGQTLDYVLAEAIRAVGDLIDDRGVSTVLVQGDTSSMLGATLAAFHHRVPVGHVEAGLRSGDLAHPFPEEMNRRAASTIAHWHFAPTARSADNLAAEGIVENVHVVGNTVVDALHLLQSRDGLQVPTALREFTSSGPYLLATAHRRESWDGGIAAIASALRDVLSELPDYRLVFATHPNPIARGPVDDALADEPRACVVDALDYPAFLGLLKGAQLVISDSGGVQEEGPTLGVPVLVTRRTTERPEGVEAGVVRLVGTDAEVIRGSVLSLLGDDDMLGAMRGRGRSLYGDGRAAERIVGILNGTAETDERPNG